MKDQAAYDSFKATTLEEAASGMWLREVFLDSTNWLPTLSESERLSQSEEVLRDLVQEGLVELCHAKTGSVLPPHELDSVFRSETWRAGTQTDDYWDLEYRQTERGRQVVDRLTS
jgi:hypothetical protein